jgi:hypothetical protein
VLGICGNAALQGVFTMQGRTTAAMSEQPPEDLGKRPVLMVMAVLLAIVVIGVLVLVYGR